MKACDLRVGDLLISKSYSFVVVDSGEHDPGGLPRCSGFVCGTRWRITEWMTSSWVSSTWDHEIVR